MGRFSSGSSSKHRRRACHEFIHLHATRGLDLGQGQRRQVCVGQPAHGGRAVRAGAAGGRAALPAVFAWHAQWAEGHDHVRGAAGSRCEGGCLRSVGHRHRQGRPVRQRLRGDQPQLQDPGAGRSQRSGAGERVRVRGNPCVPGREVRQVPAGFGRGTGAVPVVAVLAGGQRPVSGGRFRAFLCLRTRAV